MGKSIVIAVAAALVVLAGCGNERWEARVVPAQAEVIGKQFASLQECKERGADALKAKGDTSSKIECRKNCRIDPRTTSRIICDEIAG